MSIVGTKGVDISYANGNINLSKVKSAGYKWVMIRCGYGSDITKQDDSQFESNVKKAESLGMPWGVYLYSYATNKSEALSEVEHVKRLLKGKKPTLPIAIDVEDKSYYISHGCYNKSAITEIVRTFIDGIKKAGYYPMIYTGLYWLDDYIDKSVYNSVDMWIAQWSTKCQYNGKNLGMWQYGGETNYIESNNITGVGTIDKNYIYKDYPTIIKNGGYNGWSKHSDSTADNTITNKTPNKNNKLIPVVTYKVRANGRWLPEVTNLSDFAGITKIQITDIAIKVSKGSVKYRVHVKGGGWLPYVTGYNISDDINGYAGNHKVIDAIEVYYSTPSDLVSKIGYLKAKYRVSPIGGNYYKWQYDNEKIKGQKGYAGVIGKSIDRFQITLAK